MKKVLIALSFIFSSAAFGSNSLNKENIQGEYLVKAVDVFMVANISLEKRIATMKYRDSSNDEIICNGTYTFKKSNSVLRTYFPDCGFTSVSHTIYLDGQTVESLTNEVLVYVALKVGKESIPAAPFTVKKLK